MQSTEAASSMVEAFLTLSLSPLDVLVGVGVVDVDVVAAVGLSFDDGGELMDEEADAEAEVVPAEPVVAARVDGLSRLVLVSNVSPRGKP
ncbi:hypothetical protein NUU61_004547 [Penicillium alfredii]|uniref:Uncharacterized protein n=1 Tax=Penicillium alfredii TaxID=1506179 RepID=A0A9W9FLD8_9EURO|nr:uncharacterized protein NUU61_004547 [Penicillium alfredii]KAJ5102325.1 hypothetical protein NUU61_004547 [Penicillium alfredii]